MKEKREIEKIVKQLRKQITDINEEKIIEITDEIDNIFHKNGYVVSHDKIAHFVVSCIRED